MLRAGSLKNIISVQRLEEVEQPLIPFYPGTGVYPGEGVHPGGNFAEWDYGEPFTKYVTSFTTRASIKPITGNEKYIDGLKNSVSHKIEVRHRSNFSYTPEDRIVYRGRYFDIQYVLNWGEDDVGLTILAEESLYKDS